jgi:hypothetical protein
MEVVKSDDAPLGGREPGELALREWPGEDAAAVGQEEGVDFEIPANGEQTVLVS